MKNPEPATRKSGPLPASIQAELTELRASAKELTQDIDALAYAAWQRIKARQPDTAYWSDKRLMEEIDGEIRLLGRISHNLVVRLRIRMDRASKRSR